MSVFGLVLHLRNKKRGIDGRGFLGEPTQQFGLVLYQNRLCASLEHFSETADDRQYSYHSVASW